MGQTICATFTLIQQLLVWSPQTPHWTPSDVTRSPLIFEIFRLDSWLWYFFSCVGHSLSKSSTRQQHSATLLLYSFSILKLLPSPLPNMGDKKAVSNTRCHAFPFAYLFSNLSCFSFLLNFFPFFRLFKQKNKAMNFTSNVNLKMLLHLIPRLLNWTPRT